MRIPGEEGPDVLSCPHSSCPGRELPSSGLPWPAFQPYARAPGSLGACCLFALPPEHAARPEAFIWFTLLPLWVLPISSHLGIWVYPVPGPKVRMPSLCESLPVCLGTACDAPASHLASLHLWVSLPDSGWLSTGLAGRGCWGDH